MDRKLLEEKIQMQQVRNKLKQLEGIGVLKLLEKGKGESVFLDKMLSRYQHAMYAANIRPYSRIPLKTPEEERTHWIITEMQLTSGQELFFFCDGLWVAIKLVDVKAAVKSLWEHGLNARKVGTVGFLVAHATMECVLEVGCDSREEENYLMDLWHVGKGAGNESENIK